MNHAFSSVIFSIALIIISESIVTKAAASALTLEDLNYLESGTPRGYKLAAQGAKQFGSYDAWVESKGNCEIYKDKISPNANNVDEAIEQVKEKLAGTVGAPLIDDAEAVNDEIADLRIQVNQLNGETGRLQGIIGQLNIEKGGLEESIRNAKNNIDPSKNSISEAIGEVKEVLGGEDGRPLIDDARAAMLSTNSAIAFVDPYNKPTLSSAIESVLDTTENYASAWANAQQAKLAYVEGVEDKGDPEDASIRNELIILFNILKGLNNIKPIYRTNTTTPATPNNVTLADLIVFLKDFKSLSEN